VAGCGANDAVAAVVQELCAGPPRMKDLADLSAPLRSASRAVWMSSTITYNPRAEPAGASVIFVPNWIDVSEPGGVN
jgi:hypothetical protein